MRTTIFLALMIVAVLVCGCDPVGLRRIELRLHAPATESTDSIAVDSPQTEEALQILNTVALQHGFNPAGPEKGYLRVYSYDRPAVTIEGQVFQPTIPCRVELTRTGLLVTFGGYGFVAAAPDEEVSLFADVRAAFRQRYEAKNVRSHVLGHP
jgi:hypothetical protein